MQPNAMSIVIILSAIFILKISGRNMQYATCVTFVDQNPNAKRWNNEVVTYTSYVVNVNL